MDTTIQTYNAAMLSLREWVDELAANDRHPRANVIAGNVLFWAVSLDDALSDRHSEYREMARGSETGRVMLGLRFARNAVTHGFNLCVKARGLSYPMSYPHDYGPFVWEGEGRLRKQWVPQTKAALLNEQVSVYRERIEGRLVHVPLHDAVAWLEEWRQVSAT